MVNFLRVPILGRLLMWRWGRLCFQLLLLTLLILVVYDGMTGPDLASENLATVLVWVHYRGLVMLSLLLVGNLFCFACPFTLTRTIATRLSIRGRRFPKVLRNKWVSVATLFLLFWLYEWLDLWASPWMTAWLVVVYLVASFILEAFFRESPFCKYVCPIGAFNFTYSKASPSQISEKSAQVCRDCPGKECVCGADEVLGCGTELYVPTIASNMDCTYCLDCARACPFDNVQLSTRSWLAELIRSPKRLRWDLSFLLVSLTFLGLTNAFGMVSPIYAVQRWLFTGLGISSEGIRLLIFGLFGNLLLPAIVLLGGAGLSQALTASQHTEKLVFYGASYARAFVPLGFGIWLAHYGFHFSVGGLAVVPVFQNFLNDHGVTLLGAPNWELSYLLPPNWIFPLQVLTLMVGFGAALYLLARIALRPDMAPIDSLLEMLPWGVMITLIAIASLAVFNLPMEMRGTIMFGT
jgi:ferredoxin